MDSFNTRRIAGLTYIVASLGFMAVFTWLASNFGYPDVLDHPAAEVLPRLLALGSTGRAVWVVYALLPLLLIPAAAGAAGALRGTDGQKNLAPRLGFVLQVVAALAMTIGLARWSTLQWTLAESWQHAEAAERVSLTATFDALNLYLGNGIGEFVGELALYSSFAAFGLALRRNGAQWVAMFAGVTAIAGLIGMFRNITHVVQPASDITNVLLPVFLIAFGVKVLRGAGSEPVRQRAARSERDM